VRVIPADELLRLIVEQAPEMILTRWSQRVARQATIRTENATKVDAVVRRAKK